MAHHSDPGQLNNLRLFLASPGGVEDEREAARRVVTELNQALRRHGWQFEVLGWEDRGPASGRAQEDINADVERCDIFLGVAWDRWGTPTGQHSSGFAEEWHLARDRWEATGKPELWLCFKEVDDARRSSPDEQLAKVLEFRNKVQREEIVFYTTFRSPVELEVSVRRELLHLFLKRAGLGRESVGPVTIDWSAALAHEPVALVVDGPARERLAAELAERDPERAAAMFLALADEVESLGFENVSERLRDGAAQALGAAGHHMQALDMWRRLLLRAIESGHPFQVTLAAQELRSRLGPEQAWEPLAWSACVEWPDRPQDAVRHLETALDLMTVGDGDIEVRRLWRRTLWERELVVAASDQDAGEALKRLLELLRSGDFVLEGAAARGLMMLAEVGRLEGTDWLITRFAQARWGDDVSADWVSEHLDTAARIATVRSAAVAGNPRAMHALGLASLISGDAAVEAACSRFVQGHAESDLGHTSDGEGVYGLIALDLMGHVAAFCPSEDLRRSFAEMLLVYALETKWPMVNRVKAVRGLRMLGPTLNSSFSAESLRALADPAHDLDEEARQRPFNDGWVRDGELEAAAIVVAAALAETEGLPSWLRASVARARLAKQGVKRAAAWSATAIAADLPLDGVEVAMTDSDSGVRGTAMRCWRERVGGPVSSAVLERLIHDPFTSIRAQLVENLGALEDATLEPYRAVLCADEDAYVRRLSELILGVRS